MWFVMSHISPVLYFAGFHFSRLVRQMYCGVSKKTKQSKTSKTSDHQSDIKVTLSNIKNSPEAADSSLKIPDLQKNL